MKIKGRKAISFIAGLLAVLALVPAGTVEAVSATSNKANDNILFWDSSLPDPGVDSDYNKDTGWYRLVLEYGSYSSNSKDSNNNFVTTTGGKSSSWPKELWNFYFETICNAYYGGQAGKWNSTGYFAKSRVDQNYSKWIGNSSKKVEMVLKGTPQIESDYGIYRNGEYNDDGMYSLYIKYAGKSKKTGESCWYISPCDKNGEREKKLWALDCCMDICKDVLDWTSFTWFWGGDFDDYQIENGVYPVIDGMVPTFNLLCPTFSEYETSDIFKYAGITLTDYRNNDGALLADYKDNNKWIITQNSDGSWAIKSAGYLEWDFMSSSGQFEKMYSKDTGSALANGLAHYARVTAAMMYNLSEYLPDAEATSSVGANTLYEQLLWKEDLYRMEQLMGDGAANAMPCAQLVYLSTFVENVYITGGYYCQGVEFYGKTKSSDTNMFRRSGLKTGESLLGEYKVSYYFQLENDLTAENLKQGIRDWKADKNDGYYPAQKMGIVTEKDDKALSLDEIKSKLPFRFKSVYTPSKETGCFTGLYVGAPVDTVVFDKDNQDTTIDVGTTLVLGVSDKNEDGGCDGAAHIGTLLKYAIRNNTPNASFGPTITIEEGAVLQIDGPTYATVRTKFIVKGSLIINSGASLSGEDLNPALLGGVSCNGIELEIDGGSVYVSKNSILDVGYADVTITNGGSLVNDGVFIQDTEDNWVTSYINVKGGSVENGASGLFISGAEVKNGMRQTLIRKANAGASLSELITNNITGINDFVLGEYCRYPFEDYRNNEGVVNLRVYKAEKESLVRNSGTAIITGAIKGIGASNNSTVGYFMNGGTLYRGRDIYNARTGMIVYTGCNLDCHTSLCTASGMDVTTDPTITAYNSFTGLEYTTANVYVDEDGETMAEKNNIYALRVGTGSQGTDKIANFTVFYMDKTKVLRSQTISPADLAATYKFVSKYENCGTGENEKGTNRLKNYETGGALSTGNMPTSLESLSNVTYMFQTLYPLDYVTSISITGAGSGSWTSTELSVYRVSYLYPLQEYGWRSEDWFVPFTGSLIADAAMNAGTDGVKSYTFNWDSESISIGTGLYGLNVYGAPETLESKTDNAGFTYYNVHHEKVPYSTSDRDYAFSISLADADRAGIESYYYQGIDHSLADLMSSTTELEKLTNGVKLDMSLTYLDVNGSVRTVSLPYTQSAIEWAYSNIPETETDEPLHGLFQQGEDIVFCGKLPDFKKATDITLTYTDSEGGDSVAIAAISISNPGYVDVNVRDGMLVTDYPESAVSYYCAGDVKGVFLNNGQSMNAKPKDWNGTESLKPKAKGSKYLAVVQTDEMSLASTVNDITVSFEYQSLSGLTTSTSVYSLKSLTNDYYGYWLSSDGEDNDCAYISAVSSGQQMYFVIDVANLYKFTSATFTMPKPDQAAEEEETTDADDASADADADEAATDTHGDEWQMKAITIYELDELGDRQVFLGKGVSLPAVSTNRTYYRDNIYGSRGAINSAKGPLLIGPGQSKTISFQDGGISGGGDVIGKNKATDVKELSYEETKQDFGFNAKRCKYSVNVKVKGNAVNSVEDGDCGSKNQFYFQLVFEDEDGRLRTSPCVLSNQQLKGDGFRTATLESFDIYTNDDYGTPVQINVIPDDTSSTSDVFDKLCIDYISVSKTSATGVALSWKAENVGWIDIEYKDDEEEQNGRSDEEIVRSFELKDAGYSVTVEFGIVTASDYEGEKQYIGQMVADITYRDTSGAIQTEYNKDLIPLMAEYADRLSELPDTPVSGTQISLPDFMFKKGYTNRFQFTFDDISSLVKIKLKLTPDSSDEDLVADWKVTKVFARQVYNKGTLSFNIFDEYERFYSIDPQELTASDNAKPITVRTTGGLQTIQTFNFNTGNTISVDLTEGEEEVNVEEGLSEGINDVISLTAELTDSTGIAAGTSMPVTVIYKNIYGDAYKVSTELVFDADSGKFMVPQTDLPKTPDIGVPYKLEVSGAGTLVGRQLEVITVNQIRDRQVLESFNFIPDTGTRLETSPISILLSESEQDEYAKRKGYTTESQMIYLLLGSQTEKTLLSETQDLKVALVYTEKNDPYAYEHVSDFASALNSGYTIINSGTVLKLPLSINNLGEVKSVMLMTGNSAMKVNVQKGCISIEETSNMSGESLSTGWVNLPAETALISDEGTAMNTDGANTQQALTDANRISPINVAVQFSKINRSDAMVKVTIGYIDMQNASHTVSCEMNANDWSHETAWILADGLKNAQYYKVEVYDKDASNTAGVTISSLDVSWYDYNGVYTSSSYTGDLALNEGSGVTNALLNTQISGSVSTTENTQRVALENNHVNDGRTDYDKITVTGSGEISVSATLAGFPGELEMFAYNTATGEPLFTDGNITATAGSETLTYTFAMPLNTGTAAVRYSLTIRSKTMSANYAAVIYIDVEPAVYMEGVAFGSDGSKIEDFTSMFYPVSKSLVDKPLNPGDTITVYARAVNDTNPLNVTSAITDYVMETGQTVLGYEGTWTKYTLTMPEVDTSIAYIFNLGMVKNSQAGYTLSIVVTPKA